MNERMQIRRLIGTYNKLIADHKYPPDLDTKEQYRLEGYDAALLRAVDDLKDILYRSEEELSQEEKLAYTE